VRQALPASHLTNIIGGAATVASLAQLLQQRGSEMGPIHVTAAFSRLAWLSAQGRPPQGSAGQHRPPPPPQQQQQAVAEALMQLASTHLAALQPWQLANILHCCSKAGARPAYSWTERLLARLEPALPALNSIALTNALVGVADLGHTVRQPWLAKALTQVRAAAGLHRPLQPPCPCNPPAPLGPPQPRSLVEPAHARGVLASMCPPPLAARRCAPRRIPLRATSWRGWCGRWRSCSRRTPACCWSWWRRRGPCCTSCSRACR
jgi:hypothetical protein